MIEKSQLKEKIEQGVNQIEGIIDIHIAMGHTFKDHLDFECLMAQYECLIRESERVNLYIESFGKDDYINEIKKDIEESIKTHTDAIITFCLASHC